MEFCFNDDLNNMEKPPNDQDQEKKLMLVVEAVYSSHLPYHNFEHAREIEKRVLEIADRCESEGVPINREVIRLAALFHDAGYHLDYVAKGCESKEELSAVIAREGLLKLNVKPEIIEDVVKTILATHRDEEFTTNEQKALRAADLASLAGDFETFLKNTVLLKRETEFLRGNAINWEEWKNSTEKLVKFYLSQDIRLTSFHDDENGRSAFHIATIQNLQRFLEMPESELQKLE